MAVVGILGSRERRQAMGAVVALALLQVPLVSFADAPAPWTQKADQKKKKKKAARSAARRPVQQTQTVTTAPEVPAPQPVETVYVPPVEPAPPPVVQAPPAAPIPAPAPAPIPAPAPAPVAVATGGGMGWVLPVLGVIGLGGIVAAVSSGSGG